MIGVQAKLRIQYQIEFNQTVLNSSNIIRSIFVENWIYRIKTVSLQKNLKNVCDFVKIEQEFNQEAQLSLKN